METKEQIKIRKNRELKLEKVLLYNEWEERCPEERHMTWEQWLKIRKLRKQSEKSNKVHYKIEYEIVKTTSFGVKVIKPYWQSDEDFNNYIFRLEKEHYALINCNTEELLYAYLHRNRCYASGVFFPYPQKYLSESFKYILNTREHIPRKGIKRLYRGKKDRNNGRKNPTNKK